MMRIPYKVYNLMYVTKLSCTCRKGIKGRRKEKKKNKRKEKKVRYKKSEKKKYYNLYRNLPPRQRRQKLDTIKELMSYPKCRSVKVINNPARPGSNHKEVNCINYK
jgi:hypothetical protein